LLSHVISTAKYNSRCRILHNRRRE